MSIFETIALTESQKKAVIELWNSEYPKKLKHDSIISFENYLNALNNKIHFLLFDDPGKIRGWSISFERNSERWFAIIIDNNAHGKGNGTLLLDNLKKNEQVLNGWVIDGIDAMKENGSVYLSPLQFYLKNGFTLFPDERLETETMSAVKVQWVKI